MLMHTRISTVLVAIGLWASGPALAADNGFYVGGSVGQARASFDGTRAAVIGFPITFDNSSYAWKAFGGYQINQYFSAELNYVKLGEYNSVLTVPAFGNLFAKVDISGWGVALVGAMPLGKNFSLLGRIGETRLRETLSGNGSTNDNTWSPSFGIGLKYDFNPNLSARGEVERFTKIGSNDNTIGAHANLYTLGLAYKF